MSHEAALSGRHAVVPVTGEGAAEPRLRRVALSHLRSCASSVSD
jgi:hypothetical protein